MSKYFKEDCPTAQIFYRELRNCFQSSISWFKNYYIERKNTKEDNLEITEAKKLTDKLFELGKQIF